MKKMIDRDEVIETTIRDGRERSRSKERPLIKEKKKDKDINEPTEYEFRPARLQIKSMIILPSKLVSSFVTYKKRSMDRIVEKTGCIVSVKLGVLTSN